MKIYKTQTGLLVEADSSYHTLPGNLDQLLASSNVLETTRAATQGEPVPVPDPASLLAPVQTQEVWAAGVTYYRSRDARMEESKEAGGGSFYDRVYSAERPELFFKSSGNRVAGPGAPVRIRRDSRWNVPEPELTLVLDARGQIVGYTVGNDMSSRDIEGENPLYLPQAKVYDGACALGPCILIAEDPLPRETGIHILIERGGAAIFQGSTTLRELKREPQELASYLFRETGFPNGAMLLTGTGIVPDDSFTLVSGDLVRIAVDGIGTLENSVA